jgi:hypothetical protein
LYDKGETPGTPPSAWTNLPMWPGIAIGLGGFFLIVVMVAAGLALYGERTDLDRTFKAVGFVLQRRAPAPVRGYAHESPSTWAQQIGHKRNTLCYNMCALLPVRRWIAGARFGVSWASIV